MNKPENAALGPTAARKVLTESESMHHAPPLPHRHNARRTSIRARPGDVIYVVGAIYPDLAEWIPVEVIDTCHAGIVAIHPAYRRVLTEERTLHLEHAADRYTVTHVPTGLALARHLLAEEACELTHLLAGELSTGTLDFVHVREPTALAAFESITALVRPFVIRSEEREADAEENRRAGASTAAGVDAPEAG